MANKVYNSLLKVTALGVALASASCCCCNNHRYQKPTPAPRVVPQKSAEVYSAPVCCKPRPRVRRVILPYQTNEVLNFGIQTGHPLPGNYIAPINIDGTSFPIQNKNPLPGNFWYNGYCY